MAMLRHAARFARLSGAQAARPVFLTRARNQSAASKALSDILAEEISGEKSNLVLDVRSLVSRREAQHEVVAGTSR